MPSPGLWPAPTTIAVFPSSRMVSAVSLSPLRWGSVGGRAPPYPLQRFTISASTTDTPLPRSCTSTGLRSISAIVSAWSAANMRQPHHQLDERVDVGGRRAAMGIEQGCALQPGEQLARLARRQRHGCQGHILQHLDLRRRRGPPSAAGRRSASRLTPRMTSRPGGAIGCTSTPRMRACGALRRALASTRS